jgi:small-conductance mechanosensitive channel
VINLTSKNFIRFDIRVRIAFEDDIETARKEILQVLSNTDAVLNRPETSATVAEIGEYGVFFIVRFWVKPAAVARIPKIKEVLQEEIKIAFDAANISTPYPHMRLLMPKDVDYPIATKPFATTTQIVPEELPLTKGDGEQFEIALSNIDKANLIYEAHIFFKREVSVAMASIFS